MLFELESTSLPTPCVRIVLEPRLLTELIGGMCLMPSAMLNRWIADLQTPRSVDLFLPGRKGTSAKKKTKPRGVLCVDAWLGLHHPWQSAEMEGQAVHLQHVRHAHSVLPGHRLDFRVVCPITRPPLSNCVMANQG